MPKKFYLDADGKPRYMDDKEYAADQALRVKRSGTREQAREVGVKRAERAKRAESRADIAGRIMQLGVMPGMALADMSQDAVNYLIGKVKGKPAQTNVRGQANRDLSRRVASGASFGLDKRARAAINTVGDAVSGQSIPQAYRENLAAEQENERNLKQRTGVAGDVAEFAGGLAAPLGGGGKVVKALNTARLVRGGKALGTVASHAIGGAAGGALAGTVEGAARAPDWTDVGNVASQAAQTGVAGGVGGAILGPVAGLVGTGVQKLGRSVIPRTKAAELGVRRTERALAEGDLLDEMMGAGHTPARIEQRVADLEAQGAEPRLADVTEFGQRRLKALVDKGAEGVEQARKVLRSRAVRRAGRLRQEMGKVAGVDPFYMGQIEREAVSGARKAMGRKQYEVGGMMDNAVKLPPSAQQIIDQKVIPNDPTMAVFQKYFTAAREALEKDPTIKRTMVGNKPTRRTMDAMFRIMQKDIDDMYTRGSGANPIEATALKNQRDVLRTLVKDNNKNYGKILDEQHKMFAYERASEEAEALTKHIDNEPEIVLNYLDKVRDNPELYEAARAALLGKVMARVGKDRSSTYAQNLLQRMSDDTQPNHMALWNELLGGNAKSVQTRLSREALPIATDQRLMGSPTGANMAGMGDLDNALGMAGSAGRLGAGIATGQPAMAASGGLGLLLPAAKAKLQERAGATQRRQLQALTRRMKPGSLSRMQLRAAAARAKRDAIRAARYGTGGRGAGFIAGKLTEQDQE